MKDKRILITGGGGFIGTALAERLSINNAVTLLDTSFKQQSAPSIVERIAASVLDESALERAVSDSQVIIHTAARVGVQDVIQDAVTTLNTNYTGTANVLLAALRNPHCERVVSFSTSEIFGVNAFDVAENGTSVFPSVQDVRWCYALSKFAAEHLALGYHRQHGLPVTVVRPFNVFGMGRTGDHAMLQFITRALRGEDLVVYGSGSQIRAWCYIDDFCAAVLSILDTELAIGKVFNIGNPLNTITVYQLAKLVVRLCQSKSKIVFRSSPNMDITVRIPDITLAKDLLGFVPKMDIERGVMQVIGWTREDRE